MKEKDIKETDFQEESEKPSAEAYIMNEADILKGLLEAAAGKTSEENFQPIEVIRNGEVKVFFRIRPLSEEEYTKCREDATKYVRNKQFGGIKLPEDTNTVRFRSALIYTATVEEDRKKIWDNKEAQKALKVLNGVDLIDLVLFAGEKDKILERIDSISGYESKLEEVAKN
jgi:hypothetical protein